MPDLYLALAAPLSAFGPAFWDPSMGDESPSAVGSLPDMTDRKVVLKMVMSLDGFVTSP
jgi:hypothetical protein